MKLFKDHDSTCLFDKHEVLGVGGPNLSKIGRQDALHRREKLQFTNLFHWSTEKKTIMNGFMNTLQGKSRTIHEIFKKDEQISCERIAENIGDDVI